MCPLDFVFWIIYSADFISAESSLKPSHLVTAQVGGSALLQCSVFLSPPSEGFWLKQLHGKAPQYILKAPPNSERATFYNDFKDGRYLIEKTRDVFNLEIKRLKPMDMGTYYCGKIRHNNIEFGQGIELCVNGSISKESLPIFKVTEEEHIVTLSCIINQDIYGEEFRVLWFHESLGESSQKITTISGNGTMKRDCGSTECIVKSSLNYLAAGKYYCGVVMCGRVFISNETNWNFTAGNDFSSGFDPIVLTLALSNLALLILLLVFAFKSIRGCHRYAGNADETISGGNQHHSNVKADQPEVPEINYASLSLSPRNGKPKPNKGDTTYATIRYQQCQ
ncbi:immunoglobulin kappa light chain-like isoform X1 [Polypterus senegalus]|uniref:immunoglobulin kappa light chain-like isoform X1 n=1 Tax=Polypterus senegalus TaxID=55291 RepID=UPI001963F3E6|nr:immunoglobulin kappa light chain-like isoform X1 [Polypterus senegalus]